LDVPVSALAAGTGNPYTAVVLIGEYEDMGMRRRRENPDGGVITEAPLPLLSATMT